MEELLMFFDPQHRA
jgi:hypothetical protein